MEQQWAVEQATTMKQWSAMEQAATMGQRSAMEQAAANDDVEQQLMMMWNSS